MIIIKSILMFLWLFLGFSWAQNLIITIATETSESSKDASGRTWVLFVSVVLFVVWFYLK